MGAPSSGKRTAIIVPSERPAPAGPPVLVVISGAELGRKIELDRQIVIGREEGVGFRIDSDQVSRQHCILQKIGKNVVVVDNGSTNGTFVNDEQIRKPKKLTDGDTIRIGKVVLKYTESAIEAQYHEQIQRMASVDALTGAFNKRYFEGALGRSVSAAGAGAPPLSLVLFDIDHFKRINDTYGHAAGDAVLQQFASVVRGQLREQDVFCRVGGEEFALLLPATARDAARRAAEFVRGAIERTGFAFEGRRIPVTASLGVAELEPAESAEEFFKRADARLYEAKRGGRNRVC